MRSSLVAIVTGLALFFCVSIVRASDIPAGFAPTSIFASRTNISAGEAISLFSILYNSSTTTLAGDVVFTVDGKEVGTKHVSLPTGDAQTVSISWTATQGSHQASAHFTNAADGSGDNTTLLNAKADTITITVTAAAPPTPEAQALSNISNVLASSSAKVAPVAATGLDTLESIRHDAIDTLSKQLQASEPSGQVLGASITKDPEQSKNIFSTIWHDVLKILLFICQLKALFYVAVLVISLILLKIVIVFFTVQRPRF